MSVMKRTVMGMNELEGVQSVLEDVMKREFYFGSSTDIIQHETAQKILLTCYIKRNE
jgi:hypothetical protein